MDSQNQLPNEPLTIFSTPHHKARERVIYVVDNGDGETQRLVSALGYYRFSPKLFSSTEALIRTAQRIPAHCIILGDTLTIAECGEVISSINAGATDPTPFLLVRSENTPEDRILATRIKADGYYAKPVDVSRLADQIDKLEKTRCRETPYRVLLLDDDKEQVKKHVKYLQSAGIQTEVVADPVKILDALGSAPFDALIAAHHLTDFSGMEVAAMLRQHELFYWIPVILMSDYVDAELRINAIRHGGIDILPKPVYQSLLVDAITSKIHRGRMMHSMMLTDSLTGLYNHTAIKKMLDTEVSRSQRLKQPLSFVMIDLDHFKGVNDQYGHQTGDQVICSLATMLKQSVRKSDVAGRYGGEEFALILPNTDFAGATLVTNRIRENFEKVVHQSFGGKTFNTTFSAGVGTFSAGQSAEDVCAAADESLYRAKQGGRNRVC